MREKEKEKISNDLKNIVKKILLNGFKNRMLRLVDSVEYIQIQNYEIIQNESDRDHLIIDKIRMGARVFVIFGEDAKSSDDIILKNRKPLNFKYNKEIDNYELDETSAEFYDAN